MILHKVKNSPFSHNSLALCVEKLSEGDSLLLIQDAVYCLQHPQWKEKLTSTGYPVYLLKEDCLARGLSTETGQNSAPFQFVDYNGFVALTINHEKVLSW